MKWIKALPILIALATIAGCDDEAPTATAIQNPTQLVAGSDAGPQVDITVQPAVLESKPTGNIAKASKKASHHAHPKAPEAQPTDDQPTTTDQSPEDTSDAPPWEDQLQKARQQPDDPPQEKSPPEDPKAWRHQESDPQSGSTDGSNVPPPDRGLESQGNG